MKFKTKVLDPIAQGLFSRIHINSLPADERQRLQDEGPYNRYVQPKWDYCSITERMGILTVVLIALVLGLVALLLVVSIFHAIPGIMMTLAVIAGVMYLLARFI